MKTLLVFLILSFGYSQVSMADVVVIVAKNSSLTEIDAASFKRFFTGKAKTIAGKTMYQAVLKKGASHSEFLKKYTKRSPSQFSKSWQKLVFTGKAKMPKLFNNEEELLQAVSKNESLIGYVDAAKVTDKVKVIKVN